MAGLHQTWNRRWCTTSYALFFTIFGNNSSLKLTIKLLPENTTRQWKVSKYDLWTGEITPQKQSREKDGHFRRLCQTTHDTSTPCTVVTLSASLPLFIKLAPHPLWILTQPHNFWSGYLICIQKPRNWMFGEYTLVWVLTFQSLLMASENTVGFSFPSWFETKSRLDIPEKLWELKGMVEDDLT